MKKIMWLLTFTCIAQLSAMDKEDDSSSCIEPEITEPSPAERIEYCAVNKNVDEKRFTTIIKEYPNLHKIDFSGHVMTHIPAHQLKAQNLTIIKLSNGKLSESTTLTQLLTVCPWLTECILDHNELTTLDEFKIPRHGLKKLNCSNNKLRNVDVTQLCEKLPNIFELNVADNPLIQCNTKNMYRSQNQLPLKLTLKNTQLSDNLKKEIIKNSIFNYPRFWFATLSGLVIGGYTFIVPMLILTPAHTNDYGRQTLSSEQNGIIAATALINGLITGPLIANIGTLLCTNPKNREAVIFKPIFDQEPNYPEAEVTTRFQRFVRHFPYIGNLCTQDKKSNTFEKA